MTEDDNAEKDISRLIITFQSPGSALLDMRVDGMVLPGQLLALAHYLEFEGKQALAMIKMEQMQKQQQSQQLKKIVVPGGMKLPPGR